LNLNFTYCSSVLEISFVSNKYHRDFGLGKFRYLWHPLIKVENFCLNETYYKKIFIIYSSFNSNVLFSINVFIKVISSQLAIQRRRSHPALPPSPPLYPLNSSLPLLLAKWDLRVMGSNLSTYFHQDLKVYLF